jgi:Ser/Thr protein kinase RdoA (MazF antagonist)
VVTPFDDLTDQGRLRRLRALARTATTNYPIVSADASITFVARSFNTTFHILATGSSTALRVAPRERIHADGTEQVEARWMRSLQTDGIVSPPDVIDTCDGAPYVEITHPGVPGERICMLFRWIEGQPLTDAMTLDRARQMGELAALLHEHAANAATREAPSVLVADRVLYWRLPNQFGEARSTDTLFDEALDRAERALAAVWQNQPHRPHLLHGDLTSDNIMVSGRELVPIDFQDLVWGFDIQDLAITLAALRRTDDDGRLEAQFQRGYRAVRTWPQLEPATLAGLIAGRQLHQLNLALNLRRPGLDIVIARAKARITEWMSPTTTPAATLDTR